jgi:aspartate/methionine/tyrosine aminotransferase
MPQHKSLLSHSHRGDIAPFYAMEMMRHAFAMKAAGRDVLSLCVGQPAVGAPQAVRDEAARLLRDDVIGYTEALGLPALRERIAHHYKETYGVSIPAERVVITTGSSGGFLLAFLACFDAGARLALARPGYPPYFSIQKALNIEPLPVDVDETTAFQLTADHVRALCAMPGGVQGVMVASPANPTGSMLDAESFKSLAEACQAQGVRLISDEIYHGITFGKKAHTALEFSDEAIVINSFSKYYCMTGWRLGWMVVPENLLGPIEALGQSFYISPPTLSQAAAVKAFDCTEELDAIVAAYARNRDILMEAMPGLGITRVAPADGAFYLYADVLPLTNDSTEFCHRMLDEQLIAVTPGIDFDVKNGRRYVRFSFAGSERDMVEAMRRLKAWCSK